MSEISNKKKKFIKRNFKHLSIDELAQKTGLKPHVISSLIDDYNVKMARKDTHSSKKLISDKSTLKKRSLWVMGIGAIFILLLTFLVYTPALKNDFVWDDRAYVSENTLIRSLDIHSLYGMSTSFKVGNWHPLTCLSHAIDYAFWELNPLGHHLTSIIFHGLNTLLLFLLVIRLMLRVEKVNRMPSASKVTFSISTKILIVAAITALFFGLHPLHVESVAWVSERKDLLCAFFVLLSMLSYFSYTSSGVKRYRLIWFHTSLLLFIFALMSKPMAVTLPITLLLLDIYPLKRISLYPVKNTSVLWEKIPFFFLSIISSVITIIAQHSGGAIGSSELYHLNARLLNALRSLLFYLEKMIMPVKLVPFYPFPTHIHWLDFPYLLSGILVLAITVICLWMAKRERYLFFIVWSYYVVTLLPVLGIIQVGMQAAADRYTYLPSVSIFLLAGIGIFWVFGKIALAKHKSMLVGLVMILLCTIMFLLGQLTIKQIKIWQNPESLWSYVVSVFPKSVSFPHYNLGNVYAKKGSLDEAISEYKQALILRPNYAEVHNNLGAAYIKKGMMDEAISEYKQALAIKPDYADTHNNLGAVYIKKGMMDEAIDEFKEALVINPNYAKAHYSLGMAYYYKKNYTLALVHCNKAIELGYSVKPGLLKLLELLKARFNH